VMLEVRPIITDTQSRSNRDRHISLGIDAVKLIRASTSINFRKRIRAFGSMVASVISLSTPV
jgi:hypothetical protein